MRPKRMLAAFVLFLALFVLLTLQLYRIALDTSSIYAQAARSQQQIELTLCTRRGFVYDCTGRPLNYRTGQVAALVEPALLADPRQAAVRLASACGMTTAEILPYLEKGQVFGIQLDRAIPETEGIRQIESMGRIATPAALHTVGTLSGTGEGVSGAELAFQQYLGRSGGRIYAAVRKTAAGYPLPGSDVTLVDEDYYLPGGVQLTIHADMQAVVERAAREIASGAIVLLEVGTGRIRALHSLPGYEGDRLADYLDAAGGELLNRTLEPYNIGSIFKILVAAQMIERDEVPAPYTCTGKITVDGRDFYCHNRSGHGTLTFEQAFARSCNTYFIARFGAEQYPPTLALARLLGWDQAGHLAAGLVKKAGNLPQERSASGQLLANTAIGQGALLATPLDLAALVATVAGGGVYRPPVLVEGLVDREGTLLRDMAREETAVEVFSAETAGRLRGMMEAVCREGTGTTAQPEGFAAGGKTASAETGWLLEGEPVVHGTFAGYFPADAPRYALVVLVEGGRSGSVAAAPVFKEIAQGVMALDPP
ncbi:MAG: penicillin-binding protein 2 [Clostridiales bacterium]|nr:penicillin-binding protein 2 [Clostridiales bacterium]